MSIKRDLEEEVHNHYATSRGLEEGIFGEYPKVWNETVKKKIKTQTDRGLFFCVLMEIDLIPSIFGRFSQLQREARKTNQRRRRKEKEKNLLSLKHSFHRVKIFPCFSWAILLVIVGEEWFLSLLVFSRILRQVFLSFSLSLSLSDYLVKELQELILLDMAVRSHTSFFTRVL